MDCSYCGKSVKLVFELIEDTPGEGPLKRRCCFPCIGDIGERAMAEHRKTMAPAGPPSPAEASAPTSCVPCPGCSGMRRENCADYPRHGHQWCDCQ